MFFCLIMKYFIEGICINSTIRDDYSLFIASIDDFSFHENWLKLLDTAEIARYHDYKFEHDAQKFAARRFFAKTIIAQNCSNIKLPLSFNYTSKGKPILPDKKCRFNWSHSHNYIALAVSQKYQVGIDIEFINPDFDYFPLWEKITGDCNLSPNLQIFFRFWTVKEALAKLHGSGLNEEILNFKLNCRPPKYEVTAPNPELVLVQESSANYQICLAINTFSTNTYI